MDPHPSNPDARPGRPQRGKYVIQTSTSRVQDLPLRLQPREEMARAGAEHVADDVLIAIILRSGVRGVNVADLARGLVQHYGSLTALAAASVEELSQIHGLGRVKAQVLKAGLEIGRRLHQETVPERFTVRTPADVGRLLGPDARALDREVFWALHLDVKNRLVGRPREISRGLLDASLVHPREVFREAVRSATAAIVLVHNHPSGDPTPSAEDLRITKQLIEAGRIVDIKVLDHVILGKAGTDAARELLSLREEGIVQF